MKKSLVSLVVLLSVMLMSSSVGARERHFNYDEAYQILQGTWHDTDKGKDIVMVWKSKDGSECNIINGQGYTDPSGDSVIYFDRKGVIARASVTYYPEQHCYYAEMSTKNSDSGIWITWYYSLRKQ